MDQIMEKIIVTESYLILMNKEGKGRLIDLLLLLHKWLGF